jgi:hypothetical protein
LTGHTVKIVAGTKAGDVRTIASNTADTLTVTVAWTAAGGPDATSVYVIDPEDFSPGANPDFGFTWDMPSGDYNFSTYASFVSDGFSIAADADIKDGTVVGGNRTATTLGTFTNPCNNTLNPSFILYDSTTDTSNTVDALPEGTPDRFSNLKTDGGDAFPNQADANSPAVLKYPSFLNTLLDPDLEYPGGLNGPEPPISPHARYTGLTKISNDWIFFTILVFEKTDLAPFVNDPNNATHPFARYGRNPDAAGWVHILILQDPSQIVASPSSISDFCTPMVADIMLLGQVDTDGDTVADTNRQTSPAANTGIDGEGTHPLLLYALSLRDTDGDGFENSIDTCPFAANIDDPRSTDGDDNDMIDPVCDPDPDFPENAGDFDDDDFLNSQDNCPLVANGVPPGDGQAQGEKSTTYVLTAPDAGFKDDSIGDACDSEFGLGNGVDDDLDGRIDEDPANGVNDDGDGETDEDGAGATGNTPNESGLPFGDDDVADGAFLHDMNTAAVCIGGVDTTPADGFCDAGGYTASMIDTDGDGYPNDDELYMQTDPLVDCPLVTNSHDAWPSDMNISGKANLLDLLPFKKAFNTEAVTTDDNEDSVASCADGIDNGGGDGFDATDSDCTPGGPYNPARTEDGQPTCANGIDEAADGADQADPDHCYKARIDLDPKATGTANKVNLLDLLPFKEDFNVTC